MPHPRPPPQPAPHPRTPPRPEPPRAAAKCERCRAILAKAGAPTAAPCGRCGALIDAAAHSLAFLAASLEGRER